MDPSTFEYAKTLHIHHFKPDEVPWRRLGQYLYRVVEDGSNTQYRLAAIESLLPPRSQGPVFHFHEMHDEGFFKGTVRFHSPGRPDIDAKAGDMVTVPIRLPHRFSNPFDEEAVFVNTITPGFFVRYFEYLEDLIGEGTELTEEVNRAALLRFATVPLGRAALTQLDPEEEINDVSKDGSNADSAAPQDATTKEDANGQADANETSLPGRQPVRFILAYLYPHVDEWDKIVKRSEWISYIERPVDATKTGRHMQDDHDEAGAYAFVIFELSHHTLYALLNATLVVLGTLLTSLLRFWQSPLHLLLTYVIPIITIFFAWDGYVSCLCGRTEREIRALLYGSSSGSHGVGNHLE
ncbi:hypothetical protein VTN77DRAFT_7729 [Rasamsonia byssochlamydoides]|uniref:uncharacterized protein n=1 Tax=Rasamsonia byssochlamydoides TaxID=89139 RepID=UPI0037423F7F